MNNFFSKLGKIAEYSYFRVQFSSDACISSMTSNQSVRGPIRLGKIVEISLRILRRPIKLGKIADTTFGARACGKKTVNTSTKDAY